MELDRIFRLLVEGHGMQYLLSNQSVYYIKDLQPSISCDMIYLWQSMLRDEIVKQFINTDGSDGCINQFSYKYSAQTGFDYGNIHSLLISLSVGIKQAYWGIEPSDDSSTLSERFQRNESAWEERQSIINNGILRIQSNGKYGFIASDGSMLIEPQYKSAGLFNEGLACVLDFENNTYFINILGNKEIEFEILGRTPNQSGITSCNYSHIYAFCKGAFFTEATLQNGRHIFLSRDGKQMDFTNYDDTALFHFIGSLILLVTKKGELIVINKKSESHNYGFGCIIDNKSGGKLYSTTVDLQNSPILYFRNGHWDNRNLVYYTTLTDYIFIKHDGQILNDTSFSMAHQFINGIAWAKKGDKWYRINMDGDYLYTLKGFDVLTPEYRHTVLARNLRNGFLVMLSHNGEVLFTFPTSQDSEIEMDRYSHYIISTKDKDYIWYNGILTEINGKIIIEIIGGTTNRIMIKCNYILTKIDSCKFGIYDLEDSRFCIFILRNKNDRIRYYPFLKKWKRELLCCETPENRKYIVNVYNNKYSDLFDDFHREHSYLIGTRDGMDYLLDNELNIVCCFEQITPVIQPNATK